MREVRRRLKDHNEIFINLQGFIFFITTQKKGELTVYYRREGFIEKQLSISNEISTRIE